MAIDDTSLAVSSEAHLSQTASDNGIPGTSPALQLTPKNRSAQQVAHRRRSKQRERDLVRFRPPVADYGVLPGSYRRHEFVAQLRESSRDCVLSDIWKNTVAESSKLSKGDLLDAFTDVCRHPFKSDCTIVHSEQELSAALDNAETLIYAPPSSRLSSTQKWSIEKQICQLGNGTIAANVGHDFQPLNAEQLHRCFVDHEDTYSPFNILDMQYWAELSFVPTMVYNHSLLHQLDLRERSGQQGRGTGSGLSDKWMILTHGPTDSPFHADQGGKCTIVCGIEGEKIWHVPIGERNTIRKLLNMHGTCETRFQQGSARIVIRPGDMLIQSPGTPHAVVTPNDSLIAGIFIYTAATYHQSIECMALWLQDALPSNDDMKLDDLENHVRILNSLHTDLFSHEQRSAVLAEILYLLQERKCIKPNPNDSALSGWVMCREKMWNLKAPRLDDGAIEPFLRACVTAWNPTYKRRRTQLSAKSASPGRTTVREEVPPVLTSSQSQDTSAEQSLASPSGSVPEADGEQGSMQSRKRRRTTLKSSELERDGTVLH